MAYHNCATAVAISNRDTRHQPSPPPLLIVIVPPSRCPFRCCRHHPSQLLSHCTTLRHLLTHRRPSTRQLVVTSGWLSSLHLLSRHCLNVPAGCHVASQCATLSFAPAGSCITSPPPPPLNALSQCRLASHRATLSFIPAGCCVTPRRDTASQRVGWLYVASHHATLTFDPAGCCVTPCCHHRHPSRSRIHLAVHVTADENAQAHEPAVRPVDPAHSYEEPRRLPLEDSPRSKPSSTARSSVENLGKHHRVIGQRDDIGPNDDVIWHAGVVGLDAPQQQAARDDHIPRR